MERVQAFFRRALSFRNLIPLLVIVGAFIGSAGLAPFGMQFKPEQIIMALLAFLAIDSLAERLDQLANIDEGVASIRKMLTPKTSAAAFFKKRKHFPRMEQLINEARHDVWVTGVSLDTMVTLATTFESKMREGCNIRFLALDPDGHALQAVCNYNGHDPSFTCARIRSNLGALASSLKANGKGSVEIRVLDRVFPTGYFITDPASAKGQMIVQLYLYHTDTHEAPLFELTKADDKSWFDLYMDQYEKAWNDATAFRGRADH